MLRNPHAFLLILSFDILQYLFRQRYNVIFETSSEAWNMRLFPSALSAVSSIGSNNRLGIFTLHFHKSSASELLTKR